MFGPNGGIGDIALGLDVALRKVASSGATFPLDALSTRRQ